MDKIDHIQSHYIIQQSLLDQLKYFTKKRTALNKNIVNSAQHNITTSKKELQAESVYLSSAIYNILVQIEQTINEVLTSYAKEKHLAVSQRFLISPLNVFIIVALLSIGLFILNARMQENKKANLMRRKLSAIVNSSNDGIISKDLNGIVTSWNIGAERIFGYSAKEIIGHPISILFPPDKKNEEPDILKRIAHGEKIQHFETVRKRKDGKLINVSVTISPLKNAKNEIIGASKIVRDITENKRLEQQLRQSHKMGAIGQLAGGIAHDFNNLLGIIIGNLDLLERSISENDPTKKRVITALKAATRGADLTKRLLIFSRQQNLSSKPSNLNDAINNLVEMVSHILGPDINIITELDNSLPLVLVDIAEFETALLNLATNARDAMPNGGKLIISTKCREIDTTYLSVQTKEIPIGLYAAISVTDTGQGIPPEILDRVYEPFFTTKERGKGTGMGLSMVYGFAKQSGGTVKIYSEMNRGTTVTLYLPLAEPMPTPQLTTPQLRQDFTNSKILLVDDEPDLLEIGASYLKEAGYEVYLANDGKSAIDIFKHTPGITLLVTDVVMTGGMNGVELAKKMRQLQPDMAVVFVSGFPLGTLTENQAIKIEGLFLNKPYQREELINIIKLAIDNHNNA